MKNRAALILSSLTLLSAIVGHAYSVLTFRSLTGDAGNWFYNFLYSHQFYFDRVYFRYADGWNQLPAWLWANLVHSPDPKVLIYLFLIGYASLPILSLAYSLWLCAKLKIELFSLFVILSFWSATVSTQHFAVGMAANAISFYWPLLISILFLERLDSNMKIIAGVCLIGLLSSYEAGILFIFVLAAVLIWKLIKEAPEQGSKSAMLIVLALGALNYLTVIFNFREANSTGFLYYLFHLGDIYRLFIYATFTWWLICNFISVLLPQFESISIILFTFGLVGATAELVIHQNTSMNIWGLSFWPIAPNIGFLARTTAIPIATAVSVPPILMTLFPKRTWVNEKTLIVLTACFLVSGTFFDLKVTKIWDQAFERLFEATQEKNGCQIINRTEYTNSYAAASLASYGLPHLSVLAQLKRGITTPHAIFFLDSGEGQRPSPCLTPPPANVVTPEGSDFPIKNGPFNFSLIYPPTSP